MKKKIDRLNTLLKSSSMTYVCFLFEFSVNRVDDVKWTIMISGINK